MRPRSRDPSRHRGIPARHGRQEAPAERILDEHQGDDADGGLDPGQRLAAGQYSEVNNTEVNGSMMCGPITVDTITRRPGRWSWSTIAPGTSYQP